MPLNPLVSWRRRLTALLAVATGGGLGALARFGVVEAWPTTVVAFHWPTFVINVCGCLLIGSLMEVCAHRGWRTLQIFAGAGVLGGFTTFAGYSVQVHGLIPSHWDIAIAYLVATPIAALLATMAGVAIGGAVTRRFSVDAPPGVES